MDPLHGDQDHGDVDDEEEEYHDMEVQPDVVLHDDLNDEDDVSTFNIVYKIFFSSWDWFWKVINFMFFYY